MSGYWVRCPCEGHAGLPEPGERPVFGVHRLPRGERDPVGWATSRAEVERIVREDRERKPVDGMTTEPGDS